MEQQPREDAPLDEVLLRHARRLNGRWWRWPFIGPEYHLFADALFWADEAPAWWRLWDLENALRLLWHYRTGLIIGEKRPGVELWELGKRLFPGWVGFHPSRSQPDRRNIVKYRAAKIASIQCMNKWFEDTDAEPDAPADGVRDSGSS